MILLINGTNRPGNQTIRITAFCRDYLRKIQDEEVILLDLAELEDNVLHNNMYKSSGQSLQLMEWQEKYLIPSSRWLIISPEYNGSFPGILKLFIDALSVRNLKETFHNKYAGLIGVADGRAGNFRGLEHLTGILNYLKMTIYHNKLPISSLKTVLSGDQLEKNTQSALEAYLVDFIKWNNVGTVENCADFLYRGLNG
ncbi:MAG: NAD(P)H-dependent oxidoreductase [Saprospiraceae bacterium]|nr:NAD(P)H-dependent oxidoreductase [Saprospiraceae bacterium]